MRHSDQMRQFLEAQNANSQPPFANDNAKASRRLFPVSNAPKVVPRPPTPIKDEFKESVVGHTTHKFDSMEAVMERKSKQSRKERRRRREAQRERIPDPQLALVSTPADFVLDFSSRPHDFQVLPAFGTSTPPRPRAHAVSFYAYFLHLFSCSRCASGCTRTCTCHTSPLEVLS
jgi:hypothetical protein